MQAADRVTTVDLTLETKISRSTRVRQLGSMFDCPVEDKQRIEYKFAFPYDAEPWKVGLIVGPSGSGKSSVLRHVFGPMPELRWGAKSVIDDFASTLSIEDVTAACQAVGFNTIPAWMRRYDVLSNGEKFRVDIARRILELPGPVVVDEFTSVVDRQVAQVGSHAVQKYVRRSAKQLVVATCHYDVIDWLQPDWVLEMATQSFTRRSLQRRPELSCTIGRLPYAAWPVFAPFHYMSASLNHSARCYGLWCGENLASFVGVLSRPHPKVRDIVGISRAVTLPDWQGLGLYPMLADRVAAAYKALGKRMHSYPAHPALIRTYDKSPVWKMVKRPGTFSPAPGATSTIEQGGRPCAVFQYVGPAMADQDARRLLGVA